MIRGILVPIITPFKNGKINFNDYKNLINRYIESGVSGIIVMGTTGEGHSLEVEEKKELVIKTVEYTKDRVDIYIGVTENITCRVIQEIKLFEKYSINGFLVPSPYYLRPNQRNLKDFYKDIAENTEKDIIIYNIPYRTGVDISNDTLMYLSSIPNIVALKDCSGSILKSLEFINMKPDDFSVLTGEDKLFYQYMVSGYDGAILASAHIETKQFVRIYEDIKGNNHQGALERWNGLQVMIDMLFKEPNPTPVKYKLYVDKLIEDFQVRKPLGEISEELKNEINNTK